MVAGEDDREEPTTLVTCLACGGNWRIKSDDGREYSESKCAWCTHGSMTGAQVARWSARRQGRPR